MGKSNRSAFLLFLSVLLLAFLAGNVSFHDVKKSESGKVKKEKRTSGKHKDDGKNDKGSKLIKTPAKKAIISFYNLNFDKGFCFVVNFSFVDFFTHYLENLRPYDHKFRKVLYTRIIPKKAP